jgi:hypothetical protein
MESLQLFFAQNKSSDIHTIARYIDQHIREHWETVFQNTHNEMVERSDEIGDSVYGIYGTRLFRPIHDQFKQAGLRSTPRLPFGNFSISREWGPEEDRQRWFWSKITAAEGAAIGTIAIVFYHDHYQIRIPHPPQIYALEETTKGAVIRALSRISADFKDAVEAKVEIAEYLAQLAQNPPSP